MIKTTLITVGKIKEEATRNLISEYEKRLKKYTDFTHIEVPDLPLSDRPGDKEIEGVLKKEGHIVTMLLTKEQVQDARTEELLQKTFGGHIAEMIASVSRLVSKYLS